LLSLLAKTNQFISRLSRDMLHLELIHASLHRKTPDITSRILWITKNKDLMFAYVYSPAILPAATVSHYKIKYEKFLKDYLHT
jgi:hypothetical protein